MALRRLDGGRKEAPDQERQAGNRKEMDEHRLAVEAGERPGERAGGEPEQDAADDVQRPGGVEEARIVAARIVGDRRGGAHVGEVAEADHRDGDESHHPERLGKEQARQDQVRAEADALRGDEAEDRPGRAAHRAREDAFVAEKRRNHCHGLHSAQNRPGRGPAHGSRQPGWPFTLCLPQISKRSADTACGSGRR